MANYLLFTSSLLLGLLHLCIIYFTHIPLVFNMCIIGGICTSVLNHGTNYNITKWIDRVMMITCFLIELFYISCKIWVRNYLIAHICLCLVMLAVISYIISKYNQHLFILSSTTSYSWTHVLAHIVLTINNIIMMLMLNNM